MNIDNVLTQQDLIDTFGWSRYLTRTICQNINAARHNGIKQYPVSEIRESVAVNLENPRTRKTTKNILVNTLERLEGRSNVIEVNFLGKLSRKERISFLMAQREQIKAEGRELLGEVDALLEDVEQMGLG
ncbi:MAG: hypothetical protein F6J87_01930 [Spirulina sp. SIO3F2]|nr:hypothetical protein [Spirulina sp. SIO3F2]